MRPRSLITPMVRRLFRAQPSNSVVVPFDGNTLIKRPVAENQWPAIGWPVPSWRNQLQEASGSITDDVHGLVSTASGSGHTYAVQGTETAYASKGIRLTDNVAAAGFTNVATSSFDAVFAPLAWYIEFEIFAAPASGTRVLVALTGATSAYCGIVNVTGAKLRLQAATNATGTYNYADGKRHPALIEWFPGTVTGGQILGHTTSRFRVSTDKEQFSTSWTAVANGTKGLGTGGSASLFSGDVAYFEDCRFVGSSALEIGNTTTPKVHIQRKGWVVTGY